MTAVAFTFGFKMYLKIYKKVFEFLFCRMYNYANVIFKERFYMKKNNFLRNLSITTLATCCIPLVSAFSAFAMLDNASPTTNNEGPQGVLQQAKDGRTYRVKVTADHVLSYTKGCDLQSVTSELCLEENSDAENDELGFYDGVNTVTFNGGKADKTKVLVVPDDIYISGLGKCRVTRLSSNANLDGVIEVVAAAVPANNGNIVAEQNIYKNNKDLKWMDFQSNYKNAKCENL